MAEPINFISRLEALEQNALKSGSGGGNSSDMEARIAKLEASMEHVQGDIGDIKTDIRGIRGEARTDFRLLFGAVIAVALGLAGLMAHGFKWI